MAKALIMAGWDDVPHISEAEKAELLASIPPHMREARTRGIPTLGSGRVFPVAESEIRVDPFPLSDHWPRIAGIDFGWDHYSAVVWAACDRDKDVIYLYDSLRLSEMTPRDIAPQVLGRGPWVPVAWPHDGLQHDKGSGIQLAEQYRRAGLNMLHEMAQFPETGDEQGQKVSRVSLEAGVMALLQRMQSGRLKVFSTMTDWFEEFRLYHREDGKIVKLDDDLMSATRYALMMLRYAITPPDPRRTLLDPRRESNWRV